MKTITDNLQKEAMIARLTNLIKAVEEDRMVGYKYAAQLQNASKPSQRTYAETITLEYREREAHTLEEEHPGYGHECQECKIFDDCGTGVKNAAACSEFEEKLICGNCTHYDECDVGYGAPHVSLDRYEPACSKYKANS